MLNYFFKKNDNGNILIDIADQIRKYFHFCVPLQLKKFLDSYFANPLNQHCLEAGSLFLKYEIQHPYSMRCGVMAWGDDSVLIYL